MAEKKEVESVVEFIVVEPLKHNGVDYQIGETATLTEKDAVTLLELEVIKPKAKAE